MAQLLTHSLKKAYEPQIPVLEIACKECWARAGEPCRGPDGAKLRTFHSKRLLQALTVIAQEFDPRTTPKQ